MPEGRRLRGITGRVVVRALQRAGWYVSSREGSHVQMRHLDRPERKVTVPVHRRKELVIKTLRSILAQADLTVDEFEGLL